MIMILRHFTRPHSASRTGDELENGQGSQTRECRLRVLVLAPDCFGAVGPELLGHRQTLPMEGLVRTLQDRAVKQTCVCV